jgi:hypothetical protein
MYPLSTGEAATSTLRRIGSPRRCSSGSSFVVPSGSRAVVPERCPPLSLRTATKWSRRTSQTVGAALQVSISWQESVRNGCRSIITNPPYGEAAIHEEQPRSSRSMLEFLRHALALTATVQGQLALLVRLQWIAGKRIAEVMTTAPFAAVLVLTRRIRWSIWASTLMPASTITPGWYSITHIGRDVRRRSSMPDGPAADERLPHLRSGDRDALHLDLPGRIAETADN